MGCGDDSNNNTPTGGSTGTAGTGGAGGDGGNGGMGIQTEARRILKSMQPAR
jgi:hypothetical protein